MSFIFRHNQVAFIKTKPYTWNPKFFRSGLHDVSLKGKFIPSYAARRPDTGDEMVYDIFADLGASSHIPRLNLIRGNPRYYYYTIALANSKFAKAHQDNIKRTRLVMDHIKRKSKYCFTT